MILSNVIGKASCSRVPDYRGIWHFWLGFPTIASAFYFQRYSSDSDRLG
jgi:hypothetical protein